MKQIVEKIYNVLVHRRFRSGPRPAEQQEKLAMASIRPHVEAGVPVRLFQFWGGCKNPNLASLAADICEGLTLEHLATVHRAVGEVYPPGLKITIFPGDKRISRVNGVPEEATRNYVEGLARMASKYPEIFRVVPVSVLYKKYAADFNAALDIANQKITDDINNHPKFRILLANAQKNIFRPDHLSTWELVSMSQKAARSYIAYRVAEENAGIYRDYAGHIRCSFIRFSPFYAFYTHYIDNIDDIRPALGNVLHFYTGGKGNITQPWQAMGCAMHDENQNGIFLSQDRIKSRLGS